MYSTCSQNLHLILALIHTGFADSISLFPQRLCAWSRRNDSPGSRRKSKKRRSWCSFVRRTGSTWRRWRTSCGRWPLKATWRSRLTSRVTWRSRLTSRSRWYWSMICRMIRRRYNRSSPTDNIQMQHRQLPLSPKNWEKYFSGKYHVKFGYFVNFSYTYFREKMSSPKLTELLLLRG